MGFGIAPHERICENNARSVVQVILRPSLEKAEGAQAVTADKESLLSFLRVRSCADGQPLRGYPSQNDVKFVQTNSAKVFAKPFSKGLRGVGRRPTSPLYKHTKKGNTHGKHF